MGTCLPILFNLVLEQSMQYKTRQRHACILVQVKTSVYLQQHNLHGERIVLRNIKVTVHRQDQIRYPIQSDSAEMFKV